MPTFPILEQILSVDRFRQRVSERRGGFAQASLGQWKSEPKMAPFLVTNARGHYVPTNISTSGYVNFGFSPSPLDEDPDMLLRAFYADSVKASVDHRWTNRCSSISDAIMHQRSLGYNPKSIVMPASLLHEVCGQQSADANGYVTTIEGGIRIYVSGLPAGAALVLADPSSLGMYTRVGDYAGVVIQRANQTVMVVGRDVA